MKVELTAAAKYLPGRPIVVSIPDSEEDIERYLRDFVLDNMVTVSFKVVKGK